VKITFLGAAGTVTGSKYLIENDKFKFLIDCGLFQGLKELRLKNWEPFPTAPESIDAIFLTHAHIDHSGYLPIMVKNGFKGHIYCTQATFELCKILLPDSGFLHEEDAKRANKYHYSKHHPALPLYTQQDAERCLKYFKTVEFNQTYSFFPDVELVWHRAGHILGASFIELHIDKQKIIFSGDLGRLNDPIMKAAEPPNSCQTLIIESTYGDRLHGEEDALSMIAKTVNETLKRHGTILIPAFAVGRTQAIMYYLDQLITQKKIPNIPIYLDSPMAIDATKILQHHLDEHRLSLNDCYRICNRVEYVNTQDESKTLDQIKTPKIIISASGMLSGGRILHHLKRFGSDPNNTILLTGYQAAGTRGARLLNHEKQLKIHGEMHAINAQLVSLSSTSAHADYKELIQWMKQFQTLPKQIFITHGEANAALAMQKHIFEALKIAAIVPQYKDTFYFD
jgi:metallo-beta-lactamase family protein